MGESLSLRFMSAACAIGALYLTNCSRADGSADGRARALQNQARAAATSSAVLPSAARLSQSTVVGSVEATSPASTAVGAVSASAAPAAAATMSEQTIAFAWRPAGASSRAYAMDEPLDQHHVLLLRGVELGKTYPLVIALHGQPRRGQAPRNYRFPGVVADVSRELVNSGSIGPFLLVTPVFRFEGQNWPDFDLGAFLLVVRRLVKDAGVGVSGVYWFGHSGAAGCGGEGLNGVATVPADAVGFFDTCVGSGFTSAARALAAHRVPTLILHSVETAGFVPRQRPEYDADFDFGRVYTTIDLRPSPCPAILPEAPLRQLAHRCASNPAGSTLALVLDTGRGEKAHEALVPIALRFFLRQYVFPRATLRAP